MSLAEVRRWKDVFTARLYHYQTFRPDWLATTLREKKIHCADPAKLNDPWDCKPWFHKRVDQDGPALSWGYISKGIRKEIEKRRIYCLTPDPLSTLMWSHYAADHRGICLEFHLSNLLFTQVLGVKYAEEFPSVTPDEMFARVHDIILSKADCWKYEQEFRLIGSPEVGPNDPLRLDGDFLKLPDLALMSVIVGCNGDYEAVKRIVNENAPRLRVTPIIRAANEYKLLMGIEPRQENTISWPHPKELIKPQ